MPDGGKRPTTHRCTFPGRMYVAPGGVRQLPRNLPPASGIATRGLFSGPYPRLITGRTRPGTLSSSGLTSSPNARQVASRPTSLCSVRISSSRCAGGCEVSLTSLERSSAVASRAASPPTKSHSSIGTRLRPPFPNPTRTSSGYFSSMPYRNRKNSCTEISAAGCCWLSSWGVSKQCSRGSLSLTPVRGRLGPMPLLPLRLCSSQRWLHSAYCGWRCVTLRLLSCLRTSASTFGLRSSAASSCVLSLRCCRSPISTQRNSMSDTGRSTQVTALSTSSIGVPPSPRTTLCRWPSHSVLFRFWNLSRQVWRSGLKMALPTALNIIDCSCRSTRSYTWYTSRWSPSSRSDLAYCHVSLRPGRSIERLSIRRVEMKILSPSHTHAAPSRTPKATSMLSLNSRSTSRRRCVVRSSSSSPSPLRYASEYWCTSTPPSLTRTGEKLEKSRTGLPSVPPPSGRSATPPLGRCCGRCAASSSLTRGRDCCCGGGG
mmetsp:Transcript_48049/g.154539  ORF Transcript_48049/g.154539 Transcript_48049/m.154539 type:complete len:486 (+) Transcript_48049:1398-2855(+)